MTKDEYDLENQIFNQKNMGLNERANVSDETQANQPQEGFREVENKLAKTVMDNMKNQSTGLAITHEKTESFAPAIDSVERRLSPEASKEVKNQLEVIDAINANTVSRVREAGNLSIEIENKTHALNLYGINSDNLTPEEVELVYDYTNDATDEIVKKKIDQVYDALVIPIERVQSARNYNVYAEEEFIDPEHARSIQDRYIAWQHGELDIERGFDIDATIERLAENGHEELTVYLKHRLEEDDVEDLIAQGLVSEDDVYIYGPFTRADIEYAEGSLSATWENMVNWRLIGRSKKLGKRRYDPEKKIGLNRSPEVDRLGATLFSLIKDTVSPRANNIDQDLVRDYIAGEILQTRRLQAREMLMCSSALCLDLLDVKAPGKEEKPEQKLEYLEARDAASRIAYYSAKVLDIDSKEMRKRFGSNRPIKKEFFEEILHASESISRDRSEYLDDCFSQILTKIDEHTHNLIGHLAALSAGESPLFSEDLD